MMDFYWLALGVLAVWRVTHLLQAEDGPWDVVVRVRQGLGEGFWGRLLDCFYCLSLWIAAPAALLLGHGWIERTFLWLALSGGASLLERLCPDRSATASTALFREDKESDDVLLRGSEKTVPGDGPEPPPG